MTDIKELALQEAKGVAWLHYPHQLDLIDFATRLIAAYLAEQEPVSLYPCGFKELKILVIKHGAYLARGMNEDEPVTESIRSSAMVLVGYAKDMSDLLAKQPLFTAPPEPAPQPAATTTPEEIVGYTVAPVVCAAPSSEEVQWRNIKHVVRTLADWAFGSKDNPRWGTAWVAMMNGLTAKDGPTFNLERLAARVPDGCVVVPRRDVIFAAGYLQGATTSGTDAEACGARLQKLIAAGEAK